MKQLEKKLKNFSLSDFSFKKSQKIILFSIFFASEVRYFIGNLIPQYLCREIHQSCLKDSIHTRIFSNISFGCQVIFFEASSNAFLCGKVRIYHCIFGIISSLQPDLSAHFTICMTFTLPMMRSFVFNSSTINFLNSSILYLFSGS